MRNSGISAALAALAVAGLLLACAPAYCGQANNSNNKDKDKGTSGTNTSNQTNPNGNSGNSGNSGGSGSGSTTPAFQQDSFSASYGVNADFNGTPNTVSGWDRDPTNPAVKLYYTTDPASYPVSDRIYIPTTTSPTAWPAVVPAIAIPPGVQTNPGVIKDLNGNTYDPNTSRSGILLNGIHDVGAQLEGGLSNNAPPAKWFDLEGLIGAIRAAADYRITLSGNMTTITGFNQILQSSPTNYKLVYASGTYNASGQWVEGTLKLTSSGKSAEDKCYGILVLEADDPEKAYLDMAGSFQWTGLVIIVANKRRASQTFNDTGILDISGGGGNQADAPPHVLGGVIIYSRNQARGPGQPGYIYGTNFFATHGNSDAWFCSAALRNALAKVNAPYQARAWRRIE
ncbi:MAG: hypothetical protein N3A38_08375 [Planctomycetota bacterium]|nr:hypothetical protein [Planctomycetota bacterium]